MILSFALTTKEFLAGIKTVTRRNFKPKQTAMWQKAWDENRLEHDAANKVLFAGGQRIGKFRLTARPYREKLFKMTADELLAEGGMCATVQDFCKLVGLPETAFVTVIRFEKV